MNKNRIRLTESQLHRVIKESVKNVLREGYQFGGYDVTEEELDDWWCGVSEEEPYLLQLYTLKYLKGNHQYQAMLEILQQVEDHIGWTGERRRTY